MGSSAKIPPVRKGDWTNLNRVLRKLAFKVFGPDSSPTFEEVVIGGLTANQIIRASADGTLQSIADLTEYVAGTANQIIITDDGDGTVTVSAPQDIHSGASPTFVKATLTGLTATRLMQSDGSKGTASVANLANWIAGTANRVTVTDDSDGTVTLSAPQDIHTGASPTFAGATLGDVTHNTQFSATGVLTMSGDARVAKDVWLNAGGLNAPHANPASLVPHGLCAAWEFANAIVVNREHICALMRIPAEADISATPSICIGWSTNTIYTDNATDDETVEWQIEYLWTAPNEDVTGAAQDTVTATHTLTVATAANGLVLTQIPIAAPDAGDICLHAKLTRLSQGANDTISDTVEVSGVVLLFVADKLGAAL